MARGTRTPRTTRPADTTVEITDEAVPEDTTPETSEPVVVEETTDTAVTPTPLFVEAATVPEEIEVPVETAEQAAVPEAASSPDLPSAQDSAQEFDWDKLLETAEFIAPPVVKPKLTAEQIDSRMKALVDRAMSTGETVINVKVPVTDTQFEFMREHLIAAAHLHGKSATVTRSKEGLPSCKIVNKRGRGAPKKATATE